MNGNHGQSDPPRVSFITAVHNNLQATREMLRTFQQTVQREDIEFIFIDDASTDDSREFLAALPPPFRLLVNETSLGFAGANNRGVRDAHGEFLVLLNNDLIFDRPWLDPLLEPLEDPEVGAVGNIHFNPATGLLDHAGMYLDRDGMPRLARKSTLRIPRGAYREWNCLSAACLAMRRETFLEFGGFDEAYRNGCEDLDLCLRLRTKGYRLLVANESRISHIGGASDERHRNNAANERLFRSRWLETTRPWARTEWANEYLIRYSRRWWKLTPAKALHACYSVCRHSKRSRHQ